MGADTIRLDECTSLFPAVHGTLHGRISRSVYSTILGWPTNLFSNFWATLRASATSTSETKETWHQSQGIQMSSIQTWNFISWSNHIICRLYSWSQDYHSCVIKIEEETIIHHRAAKYTRISGIFRRSILNFSQTASPLYQILTDTQNKERHSQQPIDWNDNH